MLPSALPHQHTQGSIVKTKPAAAETSQHGCLFWGCLGTGIIVVVLGVIVAAFLLYTRNRLRDLTESTPRPVSGASVSAGSADRARREAEAMVAALDQNTAGEFSFTADDLNALVATAPEAREVRGMAVFAIDGDRLSAQASVPLDGVPGMAGRYLNDAHISLDLRCENGVLRLHAQDVTVKGEPLPTALMSQLRRVNLATALNRDPAAATALRRIEQVAVRDGRVIVRTRRVP